MNNDDFEAIEEVVHPDFAAYANEYPIVSGEIGRGPELLVESHRIWNETAPDLRWELYDEVTQKEPDKTDRIAVRFVAHRMADGKARQTEVAAFAEVVDKKLVEWREVVDLTVLNEHRAAAGLPPINLPPLKPEQSPSLPCDSA